jgi:hypothetical protein
VRLPPLLPGPPRPAEPGTTATATTGFGTLALRVQPADADVSIDGERWTASQPGERLLVQVPGGRHHIDIQKAGYRAFSSDIIVQPGVTTPLNVSLTSQN